MPCWPTSAKMFVPRQRPIMNNASKAISVVFVMILLNSGILRAAAANQTEQYPVSLEQKLGAGLLNTATGWVEPVKTPIAISKKEGLGLGLTLGPVMGVVNTVGRTACGLFDVVTFVLPTKPLVEPHMVWQDFYTETTYNRQFEIYSR